jgi:hypothetical protein
MSVKTEFPRGKDFLADTDRNFKALEEQDAKAKEAGKLVGRFIQEPFADSFAYYVIVKENKVTVRIRVCTGLGDDWVIPYWGEETTIKKDYAEMSVGYRDKMEQMFPRRKRVGNG